ncbi:MAG: N2N2-dimethylguanosine tRNA methyltransferase TRM1 [Candidatus Methanohalarchaeum thermophilum]|uniref:tRNA (guanine(26)-N(2))-dimethyltransferase n=1 Tax=Methanohalarchaeum thermophilum TaxID=1903181 RepID=A0A1Q6DXY4_METT1|nr:MAG: N2N2-dimethylguanosine tRNA methyltransferase TRM1 [Candidatus Methanohalarchaeum thermophilum]
MLITEGQTEFLVPDKTVEKFPPPKQEVFFNPEMEFNRDLTIALISTFVEDEMSYLDAHGATGVRGIRVKNEIPKTNVTINDLSKSAYKFMKKNKERGNFDVTLRNVDSSLLMLQNKYDIIDLDPYGSPVSFLDPASKSIKRNGLICVTATDTAPLCGAHQNSGLRKYGSKILNTSYHKESGCRALVSKLIKTAAQYDKQYIPLLTYYDSHYFRSFGQIKKGAKKSDKALKKLGYIYHCTNCGNRKIKTGTVPLIKNKRCRCGNKFTGTGPFYLDNLNKTKFLKKINKNLKNLKLNTKQKITETLNLLIQETNLPPTFYDIHKTCKKLSITAPKNQKVLKELREKGYKATKTHFNNVGIKTNADLQEFKKTLKNLTKN